MFKENQNLHLPSATEQALWNTNQIEKAIEVYRLYNKELAGYEPSLGEAVWAFWVFSKTWEDHQQKVEEPYNPQVVPFAN